MVSKTSRRNFTTEFRNRLGFPIGATPLIVVLGIAVVLGTTPALIDHQLQHLNSQTSWIIAARERVDTWLSDWQTALDGPRVHSFNNFLVPASLIACLSLPVAALVRSARASRFEPLLFTLLALVGGLVAIPAITWLAEVAVVATRVGL